MYFSDTLSVVRARRISEKYMRIYFSDVSQIVHMYMCDKFGSMSHGALQETKKKRPFCEKESFFILNQEKVHAKNHEIA